MARVTVEDCVEKLPNRFELVMVASQRARKLGSGAALTLDRDRDKNPVVSLREIAEETISIDDIREELVRNYQRIITVDEDEDDVIDLMEGEEEWAAIAAHQAETELSEDVPRSGEESDGDQEEPSLQDLAGGPGEEHDNY